jgi:hypothetical protein
MPRVRVRVRVGLGYNFSVNTTHGIKIYNAVDPLKLQPNHT